MMQLLCGLARADAMKEITGLTKAVGLEIRN